jgi:16S rRNA (cytidine1402-2'-O)-methyltransferase
MQDIFNSKKASIFFESPHHIKETLALLASHLEPDRQLVVCRELTKKFEQLVSLQAQDICNWLEVAESLKGEFVIVVAGRASNGDEAPEHSSLLLWANALSPYLGSKEIAAVLSQTLGLTKKEAYQIALDAKSE